MNDELRITVVFANGGKARTYTTTQARLEYDISNGHGIYAEANDINYFIPLTAIETINYKRETT